MARESIVRVIVSGACALSLTFLWSTPLWAQDVITAQSDWDASSAPPLVPDGMAGTGSHGILGSAAPLWGDVLQLQGRGSATSIHPMAPGPADAFAVDITREQTFTLREGARVVTPAYLNGQILFSGGENWGMGGVHATVSIYRTSDGTMQGTLDGSVSRWAPAGDLIMTDRFFYNEFHLEAGDYKMRASLRVWGQALPDAEGIPTGENVRVDFLGNRDDGLATSLAAYPYYLESSRGAVHAPTARDKFEVDGSGVMVGLLETGNPYTTPIALSAAGKVTIIRGIAGGPGDDFRREHATATAGIIAGDHADAANAGIAPKATIVSTPVASYVTGFEGALTDLVATPGLQVISMSASFGGEVAYVNRTVNENPTLTFVKSAGNDGLDGPGSITEPGLAANIITVGGVNRDFSGRAERSSYGAVGGTPMKPDIVAPGQYINVPQVRDVDGNGSIDDFGRVFLGDDFRYTIAQNGAGATTGAVKGTSFAAPHVSGAAALLQQYSSAHANHEFDHRVIKAVLLNSASTDVKHFGGFFAQRWTQKTHSFMPAMEVTRSLDEELGAGMLDVRAALRQYQPAELLTSDENALDNFTLNAKSDSFFWDRETVVADGGRVNYLLGPAGLRHLRATLTWDTDEKGGTGLMPLELQLYREGNDVVNPEGFDFFDVLYAKTVGVGENVKLFDFTIPDPRAWENGNFYLSVVNTGGSDTVFGLAVADPERSWVPWTGVGGDDNWTTAANWGGAAPVPGADLRFGAPGPSGHAASNNDFAAGTPFAAITFASDAPAYDLQGNRIVLAGPIANQSAHDQVISLGIELAGDVLLDTRAQNVTLAGALSGLGSLTKFGDGTLIVGQKSRSWTTNAEAVQNVGALAVASGQVDLKNNVLNVNYGGGPSPYSALADAVNGGAIVQSTGTPDRTVGIYDTALDLDGSTPDSRMVRVGYAAPGDTMMRGYVDSSDIINILSAGKYDAGPSDAKWHEGNFTGADKEVNSDDIIGLLSAGVYDGGTYDAAGGAARPSSVISGPPSSTRATVIYDATTGDVKIDPNGNTMTGFRLKDSAGSFFTSSASFPSGGAFITDTATQKYWSTFSSGSYLTSLWDLGNIAPTGLSEADFLSALNNLSADSTWTKSGGGTFNYNMQYVPEPSSVVLLFTGGVGLLVFAVRRRRSAHAT